MLRSAGLVPALPSRLRAGLQAGRIAVWMVACVLPPWPLVEAVAAFLAWQVLGPALARLARSERVLARFRVCRGFTLGVLCGRRLQSAAKRGQSCSHSSKGIRCYLTYESPVAAFRCYRSGSGVSPLLEG